MNQPAPEITTEDLAKLKIEIERAMMVLRKLQSLHQEYAGRDHVMAAYLSVPKHLRDIVRADL